MAKGTLTTLDTIASTLQTVIEIGEERTFQAIDVARQVHNAFIRDATGSLCDISPDKKRRYGGPATMTMTRVDQMATGRAQKIVAGTDVDFPLFLNTVAVQWNQKYFRRATGKEFAAQFTAAADADYKQVLADIKSALFLPTNYTTIDKLDDHTTLNVKRLLNADSAPIPLGPNGEVFDGTTHTHYLAATSAAWASSTVANKQTDLDALILHVMEHYTQGDVMLYINAAQETTFRTLIVGASGASLVNNYFEKYMDARIVRGTTSDHAGRALDQGNIYNRPIGVFGSAEVWVKPWIPAGYILCFRKGGEKPLHLREFSRGDFGLKIVADLETHPLRARALENEYGVGVWNRAAAAILYTGGTTYTAPTITP